MQQEELDRVMAEVGPLDDSIITCVRTPDGAYAIVGTREDDFGVSFAEAHFGRGNPAPAAFLRDVPRWGILNEGSDFGFAPGSRRAFVYDSYLGLFLVSFAEPPEPTLLLPGALPGPFCSDDSTWVQGSQRMSITGGELDQSALSGNGTVSPDGHWLVEAGAEATLSRCVGGDARAPLGIVDDAEFSPSSAHVWLGDDGGTSRILSIAEPAAPVEVWSASNGAQVAFSPSGTRALVTDEGSHSFLELDGDDRARPIPLKLAGSIEVLSLADDGVLAARAVADGGAELIWVPLEAASQPQSLVDHPSEEGWTLIESRPDMHFFLVEPSGFAGETPLVLVAPGSEGLAAHSIPTVTKAVSVLGFSPSPDGGGFALSVSDGLRRAIWVPLDERGAPGEPVTLAMDAVGLEFQPWP